MRIPKVEDRIAFRRRPEGWPLMYQYTIRRGRFAKRGFMHSKLHYGSSEPLVHVGGPFDVEVWALRQV